MKKLLITAAISLAMTIPSLGAATGAVGDYDCTVEAVMNYEAKGYTIVLNNEELEELPSDLSRLTYGFTVDEEEKVVVLHKAVG